MYLSFLHFIFAVLLFSIQFTDTFYLRSPGSAVLQPEEKIRRLRKSAGLAEMFLFLVVLSYGLWLWIPRIHNYPPAIFHTKLLFGVLYLILAKVRMLKERRTKLPSWPLSLILFCLLLINMILGAYWKLT